MARITLAAGHVLDVRVAGTWRTIRLLDRLVDVGAGRRPNCSWVNSSGLFP
jgi:hypothetical protein